MATRAGPGGRQLTAATILVALMGAAIWFVPGMSSFPLTHKSAFALAMFGLIVGAYGTMVGAGGGFLIVPMLLLAYHLPGEKAAGTSLCVVFLNATSGSISYARQGRVDYRSGFWMALATLPGSIGGAFVAGLFSGRAFDLTFAVLLVSVAGLLMWRPVVHVKVVTDEATPTAPRRWWRIHRRLTDKTGHVFDYTYDLRLALGLSFGVGFLSSILGIGGGIIHVPALIHLLGFAPHIAAATSHFILAISSGVGAATHLYLGNVLLGPAALMGIGVIGGAQVGARIAHRLKGALTVRLLSLALLVVAIRLIMRSMA